MKYTLRQLEVFLAAARFENITRAAQDLSMSQSAASSALQELEDQFDIQLFDRVGKRIQLNELGRSLRPKAQALLEQAGSFEQELAKHREVGALKLGATLTIGNYLTVALIAEFKRRLVDADISLRVANTATIAQKILNFELDIGLIEGEFSHRDLQIIPWIGDELAVFCGPQHPWASQNGVSDQDLIEADWILREGGSGTRQTFDRAMHDLLPNLQIALELQHTEAIKRSVEAGLGVSCLSEITLSDAFNRGSLVRVPMPQRNFERRFYIILHKQKYRSAGIELWLDLCLEQMSGGSKENG